MSRDEAALRMAFDARIANTAAARAVPTHRVRRHLVFQRMLCRFALDQGWVLKGGFCLEVRFDLTSRATRDLDLVLREDIGAAVDVQETVDRALDQDLGDGFSFRVRQARSLTLTEAGTRTWRMSVEAVLAGRVFESVTLDVSTAAAELDGGTELMDVVAGVDHEVLGPCRIESVDVNQHAAEKFHAWARTYAGDRPSSRVKDLVDIVLLAEAGLTDPRALGARLASVYLDRDGVPPPDRPPTAPAAWMGPYAAMAHAVRLDAADLTDGVAVAHVLYLEAIASINDEES